MSWKENRHLRCEIRSSKIEIRNKHQIRNSKRKTCTLVRICFGFRVLGLLFRISCFGFRVLRQFAVQFPVVPSCSPLESAYNSPQIRRGCSSVVERHVANVGVVGSSPITRSDMGQRRPEAPSAHTCLGLPAFHVFVFATMLREEDVRVDVGLCSDGSFLRVTHIPTGVSRGPGVLRGSRSLKARYVREIESELIERGLHQYIVPAYRQKRRGK